VQLLQTTINPPLAPIQTTINPITITAYKNSAANNQNDELHLDLDATILDANNQALTAFNLLQTIKPSLHLIILLQPIKMMSYIWIWMQPF
jgi:thermostable 8-oxoguanine DNA glycosylase